VHTEERHLTCPYMNKDFMSVHTQTPHRFRERSRLVSVDRDRIPPSMKRQHVNKGISQLAHPSERERDPELLKRHVKDLHSELFDTDIFGFT